MQFILCKHKEKKYKFFTSKYQNIKKKKIIYRLGYNSLIMMSTEAQPFRLLYQISPVTQ